MKKNNAHKQTRIMAIAPSSRGFGIAVLDTPETLVEWRSTAVKGENKNSDALLKAEKAMAHHMPDILIMQDHSVPSSRRSKRVKALNKRIIACAGARKVKVKLFTHEQIRQTFFDEAQGTKQALAEILARRFPEELGHLLPPTRRAWMSEDPRMDTFDAVALAILPGLKAAAKAAQSNEGTVKNGA